MDYVTSKLFSQGSHLSISSPHILINSLNTWALIECIESFPPCVLGSSHWLYFDAGLTGLDIWISMMMEMMIWISMMQWDVRLSYFKHNIYIFPFCKLSAPSFYGGFTTLWNRFSLKRSEDGGKVIVLDFAESHELRFKEGYIEGFTFSWKISDKL